MGVLVSTAVSLDGFMAGPRHEMDWVFDSGVQMTEPVALVEQLIASTGAILCGRNTYDVGRSSTRDETSGAFGGRWSGPELVATHTPPDDAPAGTRFVSGDIGDVVATAQEAAGDRDVLVLGGDVSRQCLRAGLVDAVVLVVLPVLLGDGVRLFGGDDPLTGVLRTEQVERAGDAVVLRLVPRR